MARRRMCGRCKTLEASVRVRTDTGKATAMCVACWAAWERRVGHRNDGTPRGNVVVEALESKS